MVWVNTFQIFKDLPIFGSGLGTFVHVFSVYRSFHIRGFLTNAENDFLQLLSEVGLIGGGLLLLVFGFLLFRAVQRIRSFQSGDSKKYITIGGMVGILALMFYSFVERNIQVPSNASLSISSYGPWSFVKVLLGKRRTLRLVNKRFEM